MKRREYELQIMINGRKIEKVIIDPHYEEKHGDSVNDEIILELVKQLDGERFEPEKEAKGYEYYALDQMELNEKRYKLVWVLENDKLYIGVINAYRR